MTYRSVKDKRYLSLLSEINKESYIMYVEYSICDNSQITQG